MKENLGKEQTITNAVEILHMIAEDDPNFKRLVQEEKANRVLARQAYKLRIEAGLSQKELASLLGEEEDTIASLEESDYEGNAYLLLTRIANALNKNVDVKPVSSKRRRKGYLS